MKNYKLGDIADIQTGPFGSQLHMSDYKQIGTPIITVEHLVDNKISHENLPLVGDSDKQRLKKYILQEGDIVFSRVGSVDRCAYVGKMENGWMFSGRCLRVRPQNNVVNSQFLSYYFGQENFKETIRRIAVGATMPSINTTILSEVDVCIPENSEQIKITNILSSLDDKIDLLNRQNKTLEALAETLFRQWFIEEVYDSWEIGKLEDEFTFVMGQSPLGEYINENEEGMVFYQGNADFNFRFPSIRVYTTEAKRTAKQFDTLVSVRAPVGDINMAFEECCLGRGVAAFRYRTKPHYYSYTYHKMRSLMQQVKLFEDSGTVFGSIGKDDFRNLKNIIPPQDIVDNFNTFAEPIDKKIYQNELQIRTLTQLRDTLLPKLMSGEVRIK